MAVEEKSAYRPSRLITTAEEAPLPAFPAGVTLRGSVRGAGGAALAGSPVRVTVAATSTAVGAVRVPTYRFCSPWSVRSVTALDVHVRYPVGVVRDQVVLRGGENHRTALTGDRAGGGVGTYERQGVRHLLATLNL